MSNPIPKKWLIISNAFNMDGRAASLTITDKIPYLLSAGIEPVVLSAVTGKKDLRFTHHQLLPWGATGLCFDLRHWLVLNHKNKLIHKLITRTLRILLLPFMILEGLFIGLPHHWSWTFPAAYKGICLINQNKIDLIYSSGGTWSAHCAAWIIKKITGVTWIAEIHDPMAIDYKQGEFFCRIKKIREHYFLQYLEKKICQDVDTIWWFTQKALHSAQQRHPILIYKSFWLQPGSEPPGCYEPLPKNHLYTEKLSISHFGSLANNRSLVPLLKAINTFYMIQPNARGKIIIHVYGSGLDKNSIDMIQNLKIQESVVAHGRIDRREIILKKMRLTDVLLLLHGDFEACSEYYPSKLYDYYWTDRPIFSLTHNCPDLDTILSERLAYRSHTTNQESILSALKEIWIDWSNKKLRKQPFQPVHAKDAVTQILQQIKK